MRLRRETETGEGAAGQGAGEVIEGHDKPKSYYEELGVSPDASEEEIRAAFRRKAKGAHPDKPGGDAAKMARANRAYETLISPDRRLTYDRTGEDRPPPI